MKRMGFLSFLIASFTLISFKSVSWALLQTDFQVLGVSTDLKKLGVAETWIEDGSGIPHCEVRLYYRDQWITPQTRMLEMVKGNEMQPFQQKCQDLQQELIREADLHEIDWEEARISPRPFPIKDANGRIQPDSEIIKNYPHTQTVTFRFPDGDSWQWIIRSPQNPQDALLNPQVKNPKKPLALFTLSPEEEPIAFESGVLSYNESQILYSPVRVLVNNHYGLMITVLRDTRQGFEGFDYHYRPIFLKWPDYQLLSDEEAKSMLIRTTEYAMESDIFRRGPNTLNPRYRAYMHLRNTDLSQEEILAALKQASPAGKLYWLALLNDHYPELYQTISNQLLTQVPATVEVIQIQGEDWQPHPFRQLLQEQAALFKD